MAFMDQIGQKLANIGQNLSQQSNNLANVTRISNDINENQRKITQLYATIGKAYYERHKSDPGAEEFECIAEINLLLAEIAEQENRMEQMKGTGKCAECGADVGPNAVFCSSCGTKIRSDGVKDKQNDNRQRCPKCGKAAKEGNLFCIFCGARLFADSEGKAISEDDKSEMELPAIENCPDCGAKIADGASFCIACGKKLGSGAEDYASVT